MSSFAGNSSNLNSMKSNSSLRNSFFILFLALWGNLSAQITDFSRIRWKSERIAPGLTWKSAHPVLNDSIPENINILIINLHKRKLSLSYHPDENVIVSKQASAKLALAAVNGGFFNIKEGGSVTYIKTGGVILDKDTSQKWSPIADLNGALLIGNDGRVTIEGAKANGFYNSHLMYRDVLVTGPLLISSQVKAPLSSSSLVIKRHPRTSVGKIGRNKIVLVTVDGRAKEARGMSLSELTDLMLSLHCKEAVNLDGGGSTTMWISGKPFDGVVNIPCDNKKFDHTGERAVSNILIAK